MGGKGKSLFQMTDGRCSNIDPIIFRPLKSLTLSNTQQRSLLRLVQAGISVYSPHTAVDASVGGVNDWLADGISGGKENESERTYVEKSNGSGMAYSCMSYIVVHVERCINREGLYKC